MALSTHGNNMRAPACLIAVTATGGNALSALRTVLAFMVAADQFAILDASCICKGRVPIGNNNKISAGSHAAKEASLVTSARTQLLNFLMTGEQGSKARTTRSSIPNASLPSAGAVTQTWPRPAMPIRPSQPFVLSGHERRQHRPPPHLVCPGTV